jgi:nitrogen fixation NifU-like protein
MDIYQEFIIELYKNPRNKGVIGDPDLKAQLYNKSCGDAITLFIKTENGRVSDAKFMGQGCAISMASSSLFTGFLKGKEAASLKDISKEDVLSLIKIDLSKNPSRMKCALLPLEALKKALRPE